MKQITSICVLLFSLSTLLSCATIMSGSTQNISFNSSPPGATVNIGGMARGTTPVIVSLKRTPFPQQVTFSKDGYEENVSLLQTEINDMFWVNIFGGGAFGSTTDYVSGSMYEYSPGNFHANLTPQKASQSELENLEKAHFVRNFLLINHARLTGDLANGTGSYLASLYEMLAIEKTEQANAVIRLRMLLQQDRNIVKFSESVISTYLANSHSVLS